MIERIFIKNHQLFGDLELKFSPGLSVFTGVSGAGKSVLMSAILSPFGIKESEAKSVEADVDFAFDMQEFGIENEEINTFKFSKDKSARYFLNNQSIAKKNLALICARHIRYLGAKSDDEFNNEKILRILDALVMKDEPKFGEFLQNYSLKFAEFLQIKRELANLKEQSKKTDELKEFAKFEIDKIEKIAPKQGEFEELLEVKKRLSKRDKIASAWANAERIFALEKSVNDALNISEIDSGFFNDCMNELRQILENLRLDELDNIDIEEVLNRIENLNYIVRRYGSEEGALDALNQRKKELEGLEQIDDKIDELSAKFEQISSEISQICAQISASRNAVKQKFEATLNKYLKNLYMGEISLNLKTKTPDILGGDECEIKGNETTLKNLSSGELNRLKLAFIASDCEICNIGEGVIILDEIDANLSGKEAMSIADVLVKISNFYQIFAISHQPQLSSKAHSHFLVVKNGNNSSVTKIEKNAKITELARMISGDTITKEAIEFAKKLLN